ncbi:hypothetical protein FXO38_29094 [Capsicum annuum]|nr:hypothetical protein FXO38_29094 [Capsicum annuum]KAF3640170.1 hypothetical protein FXO37_23633 [Capsicum annuum]
MPIPMWKWEEHIAMDFEVGLSKTLERYDSIWLITNRLMKSSHLLSVQVDYNSHNSVKIYVKVLEDMLRALVIDFGSHWEKFLPLYEFSYNNNYHFSIDIALFEAHYGSKYRSPIGWFDASNVKPLGTDLIKEAQEKVRKIEFGGNSLKKKHELTNEDHSKFHRPSCARVKVEVDLIAKLPQRVNINEENEITGTEQRAGDNNKEEPTIQQQAEQQQHKEKSNFQGKQTKDQQKEPGSYNNVEGLMIIEQQNANREDIIMEKRVPLAIDTRKQLEISNVNKFYMDEEDLEDNIEQAANEADLSPKKIQ